MMKKILTPVFLFLAISIPKTVLAHDLTRFADLAQQYSPAVVNISTLQKQQGAANFLPDDEQWGEMFKDFSGEGGDGAPNGKEEELKPTSLGSGFIISSDGYILTNFHVVRDADQIMVRLSNRFEYEAKLIGSDEMTDIALLKIDARNLPTVKIGRSSNLRVGEWVMAIGSPFGFDHSVSVGVVSATGRALPTETYVPFIQTDVAINPGNSGGPLFNTQGEVIGVNAQIYSQSGGYMGLSFAIPIDLAMEVAKQLKEKGKVMRGWLGVYIQEIDAKKAKELKLPRPAGALVTRVLPKSPAEKGSLKVNDVIISFNGRSVEYSSDLPPIVGSTPVGTKAKVEVYRNGKLQVLYVTIEELPGGAKKASAEESKDTSDVGLDVKDLTSAQKKKLGVDSGVIVVGVSGAAKEAGIQDGDVIQAINRKPVKNKADFDAVVADLPKGRAVLVKVIRNGKAQYISLRVPK